VCENLVFVFTDADNEVDDAPPVLLGEKLIKRGE
jgi:hypothetical protein